MLKKYNIALIPKSASKRITDFASNLSNISDQYLLGEHSLPHVTLYQFTAKEENIDVICQKIASSSIPRAINLKFNDFSCITFNQKIFWASLLPDRINDLHNMHKMIAEIIGHPIKSNYDPHMTLMSTQDKEYESLVDELKPNYAPINDEFILSIGESDDIGQISKNLISFH